MKVNGAFAPFFVLFFHWKPILISGYELRVTGYELRIVSISNFGLPRLAACHFWIPAPRSGRGQASRMTGKKSFPHSPACHSHESGNPEVIMNSHLRNSSYRSFHSGLCVSIRSNFHALFHFLSCFSLVMAESADSCISYQTSRWTLYVLVKPLASLFLCS